MLNYSVAELRLNKLHLLSYYFLLSSKDTLLRGKKRLIVYESKKNYYLCPVETFYDSTYTSLIHNKEQTYMLTYLWP